ncbi:MAG: amidohydrolase family protein [Acidobacteria bacterium]|nr:amidohydrolase family protein [Acidobacteriota bacterium]
MPILLLLLAGAAALLPAQTVPKRFIIDSHIHYEAKPDFFDRLTKIYRARNAMACVNGFYKDLGVIRRAAAANPDVVIPYGRINLDDTTALREIDEFAAAGFKGIKMHSPRHNWDDPQYFPLYERLLHHKLLALFHTGIASHSRGVQFTSMERMRPSHLDTLSRAFPALVIQGAHLGNPWYEEAAEAARWAPRLYFDLTGSTLIKKAKNLSVFREYLWWEGPQLHSSPEAVPAFEKIVFGTDEPPENLDIVLGRYEAMLNACEVPEAIRKKVYGETMARWLGIKVR